MEMVPFFEFYPELAFDECRFVFFVKEGTDEIEEDKGFALMEYYCPIPNCDCRRVQLVVTPLGSNQTLCTIGYGFDRDRPDAGPFIDPLNYHVPYAEDILEVVDRDVLQDQQYVARLERHYHLVKQCVRAQGYHPGRAPRPVQEVIAEKRSRLKQFRKARKKERNRR